MMFVWVLGLILVVYFIWYFNRGNIRFSGNNEKEDTPMKILEKRYAKGEISQEEYEERKKILQKN